MSITVSGRDGEGATVRDGARRVNHADTLARGGQGGSHRAGRGAAANHEAVVEGGLGHGGRSHGPGENASGLHCKVRLNVEDFGPSTRNQSFDYRLYFKYMCANIYTSKSCRAGEPSFRPLKQSSVSLFSVYHRTCMLNMETTAWDELQKESRRKEQEVGHQLRRCDCARPGNEQASTQLPFSWCLTPPPALRTLCTASQP